MNADLETCITHCLACYRVCQETLMNHCLLKGGKYTEPSHFRLMAACAEICRTASHLMILGAPQHIYACAACAKICTECAESCRYLGDMDACVQACRRCAESCQQMSTTN